MAASDHFLRFRLMSTEELTAAKNQLEAQNSILVQQSMGTKSATRDIRYLADQLNAIAFVMAERGVTCVVKAPFNNAVGITDFSAVGGSAGNETYPAGTTQPL